MDIYNPGNNNSHAYESAFKIYKKVIDISANAAITNDQKIALNTILAAQPDVVYDMMRDLVGSSGRIVRDNDNDQVGFVFLKSPLSANQSRAVDHFLLQHHLHIAKQLILLLDLQPQDLGMDLSRRIKFFLFGQVSGQTNDYLNSINIMYGLLREKLSRMAYQGKLSAKQTIAAKIIIHTLNKESVTAMVYLLNLNDTAMSPDELIALITRRRTDGSLEATIEHQIKEVVYFKKLRAIQDLVMLLHLERYDIAVPTDAPEDLVNVIFSPGIFGFESEESEDIVVVAAEETGYEATTEDFFCMPCFHKAYTEWKSKNGAT